MARQSKKNVGGTDREKSAATGARLSSTMRIGSAFKSTRRMPSLAPPGEAKPQTASSGVRKLNTLQSLNPPPVNTPSDAPPDTKSRDFSGPNPAGTLERPALGETSRSASSLPSPNLGDTMARAGLRPRGQHAAELASPNLGDTLAPRSESPPAPGAGTGNEWVDAVPVQNVGVMEQALDADSERPRPRSTDPGPAPRAPTPAAARPAPQQPALQQPTPRPGEPEPQTYAWADQDPPSYGVRFTPHPEPRPLPSAPPARRSSAWERTLMIALLALGLGAMVYGLIDPLDGAPADDAHLVLPAIVSEPSREPAATSVSRASTTNLEEPAEAIIARRAAFASSTQIISEPAGAEIVYRGAVVANTPARVPRPGYESDFLVRLKGYESQLVRLGPHSGTSIHIVLEPSRASR